MKNSASCCCGQLKLACTGEPVRISVCHCLACQRRTGSVFGVQARFPDSRIEFEGASTCYVRVCEDDDRVNNHFCPECGTTVYWDIESAPGVIAVAVGSFANPRFLAPSFSVYEARKHDWVIMPENIEHWD